MHQNMVAMAFHFRKSAAFSRKPREKSKFRMKGEYGM